MAFIAENVIVNLSSLPLFQVPILAICLRGVVCLSCVSYCVVLNGATTLIYGAPIIIILAIRLSEPLMPTISREVATELSRGRVVEPGVG